jgi:hypothetical protein
MRSALIAGLVAVTALGLTSCRQEPKIGGESAISKDHLAGTECVGWTGGPSKFRWSFSEVAFRIEPGADPVPRELLDELVGEGKEAKKIEGAWRLDGMSLILFDVKADNQPTGREGRLSAFETGALRVTIPGRSRDQYIFDRPTPPGR